MPVFQKGVFCLVVINNIITAAASNLPLQKQIQ